MNHFDFSFENSSGYVFLEEIQKVYETDERLGYPVYQRKYLKLLQSLRNTFGLSTGKAFMHAEQVIVVANSFECSKEHQKEFDALLSERFERIAKLTPTGAWEVKMKQLTDFRCPSELKEYLRMLKNFLKLLAQKKELVEFMQSAQSKMAA